MCETLERIYNEMNQRNTPSVAPPICNPTLSGFCYAAYGLGDWYLKPSWIRLHERLRSFFDISKSDLVCLYKPQPEPEEGHLHQTLLQYESFDTAMKLTSEQVSASAATVKDILETFGEAITIQYRGLVWTRTGLALAGYPYGPDDYGKLMKLRKQIQTALEGKGLPFTTPYDNDICHATLLRWEKIPDFALIEALEKETIRWSEAIFGEIRIGEWRIGKASWQMRDEQRQDLYSVSLHNFIAHRGNIEGVSSQSENDPTLLMYRLKQGISVECDVWYKDGQLWLGHDAPEYKTEWRDLIHPKRLIHAKDGATFEYLMTRIGKEGVSMEVFYHTTEDYVVTNLGRIIVYPGKPLLKGCICMMPERGNYTSTDVAKATWICSDDCLALRKYFR
jgi:hypothetical protein